MMVLLSLTSNVSKTCYANFTSLLSSSFKCAYISGNMEQGWGYIHSSLAYYTITVFMCRVKCSGKGGFLDRLGLTLATLKGRTLGAAEVRRWVGLRRTPNS